MRVIPLSQPPGGSVGRQRMDNAPGDMWIYELMDRALEKDKYFLSFVVYAKVKE